MSDIDLINYGFPPQQPWDGPQMTSDMLILLSQQELYLNLRFPMSIMGPDMNKTVLLHFDKAEVNTWASALGILSRKSRARSVTSQSSPRGLLPTAGARRRRLPTPPPTCCADRFRRRTRQVGGQSGS